MNILARKYIFLVSNNILADMKIKMELPNHTGVTDNSFPKEILNLITFIIIYLNSIVILRVIIGAMWTLFQHMVVSGGGDTNINNDIADPFFLDVYNYIKVRGEGGGRIG